MWIFLSFVHFLIHKHQIQRLPSGWTHPCFPGPPDEHQHWMNIYVHQIKPQHHNRLVDHVLLYTLICISESFTLSQNEKRQKYSLQSAEQTSSVPPWWGGQQLPQHQRTPHFHAGRAGEHCGEQTAGAHSEIKDYRDHTLERQIKTLKRTVQPPKKSPIFY